MLSSRAMGAKRSKAWRVSLTDFTEPAPTSSFLSPVRTASRSRQVTVFVTVLNRWVIEQFSIKNHENLYFNSKTAVPQLQTITNKQLNKRAYESDGHFGGATAALERAESACC